MVGPVTTGERGPAGDHGQSGEPGRVGATGAKGEKGERGLNPWAVRHATLAFGLLAVGLFLFAGLTQHQERQNDERDAEVMARFEREVVATDQAFCALTNRTFAEINKNREANRRAYSLLPASTPEGKKFRDDLLATIDGDLPQLDCSGIGNGEVDFSLQDTIRNGTLPTPTTRGNP